MSHEASTVRGDQSVEELRRELAEAREQQAATAEILRATSSSPTDLQRVFSEIAASAARVCDAHNVTVYQVEGNFLLLTTHHGSIPVGLSKLPLTRGIVVHARFLTDDRSTSPVCRLKGSNTPRADFALRFGHRTILAVPIIHAGVV